MVGSDAVVGLLGQVLQARPGLETLSLKNLKPEAVGSGAATQTGGGKAVENLSPVLWRHRVELKVRGSYADTVAYLQHLENLQSRFGWQALSLETDTTTGATHTISSTLTVTTLSLEAKWLGL